MEKVEKNLQPFLGKVRQQKTKQQLAFHEALRNTTAYFKDSWEFSTDVDYRDPSRKGMFQSSTRRHHQHKGHSFSLKEIYSWRGHRKRAWAVTKTKELDFRHKKSKGDEDKGLGKTNVGESR